MHAICEMAQESTHLKQEHLSSYRSLQSGGEHNSNKAVKQLAN